MRLEKGWLYQKTKVRQGDECGIQNAKQSLASVAGNLEVGNPIGMLDVGRLCLSGTPQEDQKQLQSLDERFDRLPSRSFGFCMAGGCGPTLLKIAISISYPCLLTSSHL